MLTSLSHRRAIVVMLCAATLWSIAGVLTRHLHAASGFEVTFWRSVFAALFVVAVLGYQHKSKAFSKLIATGKLGWLSGLMWCAMFCFFMIALTMTTVANTLIVMSLSPLLTALLAGLFLKQRIAYPTWIAIVAACGGMVWMFSRNVSDFNATQMTGMLVALGVPIAASINFIVLKKAGKTVDLIPAIGLGAILSASLMLPLALPLQASLHDITILAILGFFQLAFPCMLMVSASRSLSAPEISLLALLEVLLGPIWAWLGAGEIPMQETLTGGAIVLLALAFNELAVMRQPF